MNDIKTWEERHKPGVNFTWTPTPITDAMLAEIAELRAALITLSGVSNRIVSAREQEMAEVGKECRVKLQRMFDSPESPLEAAFKDLTLSQGSQPKEWDDTAPVMVWYGFCEFKKGYEAGAAHQSKGEKP